MDSPSLRCSSWLVLDGVKVKSNRLVTLICRRYSVLPLPSAWLLLGVYSTNSVILGTRLPACLMLASKTAARILSELKRFRTARDVSRTSCLCMLPSCGEWRETLLRLQLKDRHPESLTESEHPCQSITVYQSYHHLFQLSRLVSDQGFSFSYLSNGTCLSFFPNLCGLEDKE